MFITTRKNVMNQSHFKVKACNGYQAREKHYRCQGRPTGAKGGRKARIEFDSTSDRLKKSHFLIGYSPLHAIFELIMEYERNAISLDTSKITVSPVFVKTRNPSCYRISIVRKRYQNSKNNVLSRSS